ncbi:MAG: lysophospholipid acyltransferase family protein [Gammaproteobacteria bacterium]|nr:lysophospholipid acyltransferase family protein [Gammaproteobacteria bacterium]
MAAQTDVQLAFPWWHYLAPWHWHTWLGLGLLWLMGHLPLSVIAMLGTILGELLFRFFGSRRRVVEQNLSACFPETPKPELNTLVRRNFHETGKAVAATGIAWWGSRRRLENMFRLIGEQHLEAARETGRPVILLVGHCVALEIAGCYMAGRHKLVDIYRKPRNRLLDAVIRNRRTRWGQGTLAEFKDGLKPVVRALKQDHWFFYLPDQDFGRKRSIFVPFFGVQAATLPTLAKLCKLTNAIVVPCFINQLPRAEGFEIIFEPALENYPEGDDYNDAVKMNQVTESLIRRYPDQYFWLHKRFKTRPDGEPRFYD